MPRQRDYDDDDDEPEEEEEDVYEEEDEEEEEDDGGKAGRKRRRSDFIDDAAEEDDDEDEDDDDEDYGGGGGGGGGGGRRRPKRRTGSEFFDLEAAVDSDEDEEEEEGEDDFIVDSGADIPDEDGARREYRHRLLPHEDQEEDLEELTRSIKQRYARSPHVEYDEEATDVEQQALLPSVRDPKLWMVKCAIGREREVAVCLMQKAIDRGPELQIRSVVALDHLKNYIYIEADKEAHVREACKGMRNIYASAKIMLVPIKEMTDVLSVESKAVDLARDTWVRMKMGTYKGDLAKVMDVDNVRQKVVVKLTAFIAGPTTILTQINHAIGAEGVVSSHCKTIVHDYGRTIWERLLLGLHPDKVCHGICSHNETLGVSHEPRMRIRNSKSQGLEKDILCNVCEMVAFWIQVEIRKERSKDLAFQYVNQLCEKLPNPGGRSYINCDVFSLPHITFTIGNKSFPLSPDQYVIRVDDHQGVHCLSGFTALNVHPQRPLWVLGDAFLRAYHSVFDFDNLQIGFAESA